MSAGKHTIRHLRPHVWRARWRARWAGLLILPTMFMAKAPAVTSVSTDSSGNLPKIAPSWSVPQETRARLGALKRSRAERRRLAAEARARAAAKRERERRERERRAERAKRVEEQQLSRAQKVLRRARELLGVPYVWGGASSSGLDCSGFTMLAFRAAGIELPHASWLQPRYGVRVSDPRPGDLVKWPWNHVAIYLGGGQVIGAHHRGEASSISPIYGSPTFYRLVS